jgi:hypothetical protein
VAERLISGSEMSIARVGGNQVGDVQEAVEQSAAAAG